MQWADQRSNQPGCYLASPRTLSFIIYGDEVLLLRGAPHKKLWAGLLNGVGGHIEPGEDIVASARREIEEESGLVVPDLDLRALVHISNCRAPGVILCIFVGRSSSRVVRASTEGDLAWYPIAALPLAELVDDLKLLLPRLLAYDAPPMIYGRYVADTSGVMTFQFTPA
jgi:8-oxo-dGTP diphosphatase